MPFVVHAARGVVVLDLGNAVPETAAGGPPSPRGPMRAVILWSPPETLGEIDYSQAHYEASAGVNEVALTPRQVQRLAGAQLGITVPDRVLAERPSGLYVDATEIVWRMDPGTPTSIELVATEFRAPLAGRTVRLRLGRGDPASSLTFDTRVDTDAGGRATVAFSAEDPAHPREHLDGQCYEVDFYDGVISPSNALGALQVRVFDRHPVVEEPTWEHVRPILAPYARLYPFMRGVLDLGDPAVVRQNRNRIRAALSRPHDDSRYMPVTRDLSNSKRDLLLRWIDRGAP